MKITIESTTKIVTLEVDGRFVPARIWQGETASGIPVQCFITRIAPEIKKSEPKEKELTIEFQKELEEQAAPRMTVEAIPLHLIL